MIRSTLNPISSSVAKVNASGTALVYCGYIGGSGFERGGGIAVDAAGNAYVTGSTSSDEKTFPVRVGPDLTYGGGDDAFVAKVNAQGSALDYCGYIGGTAQDSGQGIALDPSGNVYVAGKTSSTENTFPVKGGPDQTHNGNHDVFVAKVHARGTGLDYCGYIGGVQIDWGHDIAVDRAGNAYVTGTTYSDQQTFPVKTGPDLTINCILLAGYDAFVAKVGSVLVHAAGTTRPGGAVTLALTASTDGRLPYQLGTSLGTDPVPIDTRKIDLSPDDLLAISMGGWWPSVFQNYRGMIDSQG